MTRPRPEADPDTGPDADPDTGPDAGPETGPGSQFAGFAPIGPIATVQANRSWWDREARAYRSQHETDLGGRLIWGPEGLDETDAGLLGDPAGLPGLTVLEVGAGAGDGARWLCQQGVHAAASDLSIGMLRQADGSLPGVQADARRLPFASACFDVAFTAYGALPFVADPERVHREIARVLRPGGRWVFALSHPIRWAFPDDPGPGGLTATRSYFDRTPYQETGRDGAPVYAEHHRTLGDQVRMLISAGFVIEDLVEPEWPEGLQRVWGGWSPARGRLIPGTAIFCCRLVR